jgi:rhodanese-related sulfurtransferase
MRRTFIIGIAGVAAISLLFAGAVTGLKVWPSILDEMWSPVIDERIALAKKSVNVIEMAEFQRILLKTDYDMIIDVREAEEYAAGHIPGAVNIPRGVLEFEIWQNIGYPERTDMTKKIYLYCQEGRRAVLCTKALQDLGFSSVTAVQMPLDEWTFAGGTTATLEGSASFKSDPNDYNLDFGGTYYFESDPSDYNIDYGIV